MERKRHDERGSILVLALLVSLILLGFGLTVMWVASSGVRTSANINRREEAVYAAESGVDHARLILGALSATQWNDQLLGNAAAGCTPACPLDPVKGRIVCGPGNICLSGIQVLANTSQSWVGQNPTDPSISNYQYTIWIRNDWQDECDTAITDCTQVNTGNSSCGNSNGTCSTADGPMIDNNGRIVAFVEGIARDGLSSVRLEVFLTRQALAVQALDGLTGQKRFGGQGGGGLYGHTM